jgi:hypothetical protein
VNLVQGGWNGIQVEGETCSRRVEQDPGKGQNWYHQVELVQGEWNRIQVEGGPGTRRVERDTGRGWNWYQKGGTGSR